jgi:predicted nucleotidyltransferase
MDRRTLTREEALDTVRRYKQVIRLRYKTEPKVIMYGSYAKGYANPDSDIDVAVILPESEITDPWEQWADIAGDVRKVSTLIEPVLMEDQEDSMLYREVMRTGVAV